MKIYISSAETGLTSKKRTSIAKKSTDPNELSSFAHDNSELVRLAVFKNKYTPQDTIDQLAQELVHAKSGDVRREVVDMTTDPDILAQFADDPYWDIRWEVAKKTNDPDTLAKLADDENGSIRATVVKRTDDPDILAKSADDEDKYVRIAVARNTDDPDILAKLADDEEWRVRLAVARGTDDPDILAQLADDEDEYVRRVALKRYQYAPSRTTPTL